MAITAPTLATNRHEALIRLVNAFGIDTKMLFTSRIVIDIKPNDAVRLYVQACPNTGQIERAAKVVETTRLDNDETFAECIVVDAVDVDEKGNVSVNVRA